jgi:hypothetical protein
MTHCGLVQKTALPSSVTRHKDHEYKRFKRDFILDNSPRRLLFQLSTQSTPAIFYLCYPIRPLNLGVLKGNCYSN